MSKILISEPILTLRWSKRGFKGSRKWLDYSNINKFSYFQKYGIPQKSEKPRKNCKIQEPCTMCSRYARLKISFVVILHIYMNTLSCSGFCELTFRYFTALWNTLIRIDIYHISNLFQQKMAFHNSKHTKYE